MEITQQKVGAFRDIPYMGVIWVVAEAMKLGFYNGHPEWSNLGQGQPEIGPMEGAPDRISNIKIEATDQQYGHINGTDELCQAIADHYNRIYRQGKASQYKAENVSVAMGGRLVLSRVFAALKDCRMGYQVPDYTAYEDMFGYQQGRIEAVLVPTSKDDGFGLPAARFAEAIKNQNLDAFLFSNPCNPTGNVIAGKELNDYVKACRESGSTLIADEFYSHFIYEEDNPGAGPVSTAAYVEDVNTDAIVLIDGLTKSFRYPGWRIGWALGPKEMIENMGRAASAIDGGPSQPMQRAALEALQPAYADQETNAVRQVFSRKRNIMLQYLQDMGIQCYPKTMGTFYTWADISQLPSHLNTADAFFEEALKRKVMTVPGHFFDVDPGAQRDRSSFRQWVRFSFGPPEENMIMGLERLKEMLG